MNWNGSTVRRVTMSPLRSTMRSGLAGLSVRRGMSEEDVASQGPWDKLLNGPAEVGDNDVEANGF